MPNKTNRRRKNVLMELLNEIPCTEILAKNVSKFIERGGRIVLDNKSKSF